MARRTAVVVGVAGELLVTAGVVVALFAVWLLWWTDVVAVHARQEVVAGLDWARPAEEPRAVAPAAPTAAPPTTVAPGPGETFAVLVVPRWSSDPLPVSEGTDRAVLDTLGVGHYPGTALPGETGNFAIAGHRVTYGRPFARVEELRPGDELEVRTAGGSFVYRVTSAQVVAPSDVSVLLPVPGEPEAEATTARITLTTCHPMYSARERYVVHGELDRWTGAGEEA